MKTKIFSVTKKDLDIQSFRTGGAGGQHRDKTSNGVRVVHRESGAVGMSTESRSWNENRRVAFRRMAESNRFKMWLKKKFPPEGVKPQPNRRYTYKAPNITLEDRKLQER